MVMRSCLTNGVMLTPFPYLGVCRNGLNLGCHTKPNARENRIVHIDTSLMSGVACFRCVDASLHEALSVHRSLGW